MLVRCVELVGWLVGWLVWVGCLLACFVRLVVSVDWLA